MKKFAGILIPLTILSGVTYLVVYLAGTRQKPGESVIPSNVPALPSPLANPEVSPSSDLQRTHYPIPRDKKTKGTTATGSLAKGEALSLDDSDSVVYAALSEFIDNVQLQNAHVLKEKLKLIRKLIVRG